MRDTLLRIDALARTTGAQAALDLCLAELAAKPAFELWVTAAGLALRLQQHEQARQWLQQAHTLRPEFEPVRRQLSQVLNHLMLKAADAHANPALQQALQLWPENQAARFNLAQRLVTEDAQEALSHAQILQRQAPDDLDAGELLGRAAAACGDAEALQAVSPVLLAGQRQGVLRRCAEQLAWNGAPAVATAIFKRLHAARPADLLSALAARLALPACYASSEELAQVRATCTQQLAQLHEQLPASRLRAWGCQLEDLSWNNFLLAYQGGDDRQLQADYGDWLAAAATALFPHPDPRQRPRRAGRRRVGLLSSFWRRCTVGAYFGAWAAALAEDSEVYLLCNGPADDWTGLLTASVHRHLQLDGPLAQQATAIAALELDLLIYPELGMHGQTMVLAALRLARQQWCGWGHPVSSGLPSIDRQISVATMEPDGAAQHYREPLLLLPGLGTRYQLPIVPPVPARTQLGLPAGLLFVLPSSAFKLHPDGDAELAALLARYPHAHAVLLRTEPAGAMQRLQHRLTAALSAHGADPQRQLRWLPALSREHFLGLLGCCDLLLDPWHWSGGNTALDALATGLPILTRWGRFMRGRQSAAMLEQLQLPGVDGQHALIEHADARAEWRSQLAGRLPELVAGQAALQALRSAVTAGVPS